MSPSPAWFRPLGIPLRIHWSLLLFLPFLIAQVGGWLNDALPGLPRAVGFLGGLVGAVGLFTSVALHELGHAQAGKWRGYRTRDILLLPIGGIARLERLPASSRDELIIAIAGPIVSVILGVLGLGAGLGFYMFGLALPGILLLMLGGINLMLALFNLIPCFPMDGGRVLRALAARRMGLVAATRLAMRIGTVVGFLMISYGIFAPNLMLVVIAIFIMIAARAEYRMVLHREQLQRLTRAWGAFWPTELTEPPPDEDIDVEVGPPPYRR